MRGTTEITPSEELAGLARALYAAMGAGDAAAVEAFYSRDPHAVFVDAGGVSPARSR
jgi:hypothetical protein